MEALIKVDKENHQYYQMDFLESHNNHNIEII